MEGKIRMLESPAKQALDNLEQYVNEHKIKISCFNEIVAVIRTALTASSQAWLPIAEAPRDGTEFLAYSNGRIYITRVRIDNHGNNKNTYVACPKKPTHWMPLPPPPVKDALEGELK